MNEDNIGKIIKPTAYACVPNLKFTPSADRPGNFGHNRILNTPQMPTIQAQTVCQMQF
jgi:hypothetical protein